jgi:hypothetical protein
MSQPEESLSKMDEEKRTKEILSHGLFGIITSMLTLGGLALIFLSVKQSIGVIFLSIPIGYLSGVCLWAKIQKEKAKTDSKPTITSDPTDPLNQ